MSCEVCSALPRCAFGHSLPLTAEQDKMVSKGVASVPSPVRNLEDWSSLIDHDSFARAVIGEFVQLCAQNPDLPATMTQMVDEAALLSVDEIRKGTDELRVRRNRSAKPTLRRAGTSSLVRRPSSATSSSTAPTGARSFVAA